MAYKFYFRRYFGKCIVCDKYFPLTPRKKVDYLCGDENCKKTYKRIKSFLEKRKHKK